MSTVYAPLQMAPTVLSEPILPGWQFSLFSVNLGESSDPNIEKIAVERVGSYGKQLGHLAEALEIVIERLELLNSNLPDEKKVALAVFLDDVAAVRKLKEASSISRHGPGAPLNTADVMS